MSDSRCHVAALLFPGVDQLDLTGPFEVLSRLPDVEYRMYSTSLQPVRDMHGLLLTPDDVLANAREADVLLVPGGAGAESLLEDDDVLAWLRRQAESARVILCVCTGALLLGAAGLLKGARATTHWAFLEVLEEFGAVPSTERVLVSGKLVFTAGVTSGIDGALRVAAILYGEDLAKETQLAMQYAPDPLFTCGSPHTADEHIVHAVRQRYSQRLETTRQIARKLQ